MNHRDTIFGKIVTGLKASHDDKARQQVVDARIAARFRHPTPARVAGRSHDEHLALFKSHMVGQSATVLDAATAADVPSLIANYLRQNNLPARLAVGDDAYLAALPWSTEPTLERRQGRAQPTDEVSVSHASAGVAETGTLVMASGPDNPVTLNFLPETHIVVLEAKDVVGPYEDAWMKIRARFGDRAMPRTVNMISGPSRTGDIGGRLVMGAHGPRRMCVVVVRGR
jgi:L-lactate dehydrogenase complex protein LldG